MQTIKAYLQLVRWLNLLIMGMAAYWFYAYIMDPVNIAGVYTHLFLKSELALFIIAVVCIGAAGNVINDYMDIEVDRIQRPDRPLPSGLISMDTAYTLYFVLNVIGIAAGFYLSYHVGKNQLGYMYVISAMLLYLYSGNLKKIPLVGNITVAFLISFIFILLFVYEANFMGTIPLAEEDREKALRVIYYQLIGYGLFAFVTNLNREIVKDIEDMAGDAQFKINTLAVKAGFNITKWVSACITLVLIAGLGFIQYIMWYGMGYKQFGYISLCLQLPLLAALFFTIRAKAAADFAKVSTLLKVIMVAGIATMPVFYWLTKIKA
jgi:4-hydroxybenzoate polyprenyltransferase